MRILYLSQYFPPEVGATQTRAYEMAQGLIRAGHEVTILTEVPNHPEGIIRSEYRGKLWAREDFNNIDAIRVWVKTSATKTFKTRLTFYLSFMANATLAGLFLARGHYDFIYATSPPLFAGGTALALSYLRRIPLVFEVRDLWPESAVALGELKNPRFIRWATWLEETCYRRARRIVVVTHGIQQRLIERGFPERKIILIPNGANTALFHPQPEAGQSIRRQLGLVDKFLVIYAGIHGVAQGLETVLEAAQLLEDRPQIHFLFVGAGPRKAKLSTLKAQMGLNNVTMLDAQPRETIPAYLSAADLALVPLKHLPLFHGALPSKMFDAWACACPILLGINGEAHRVLEEAQAGVFVKPEDPVAMAQAIRSLSETPERRQRYRANGRRFVVQHYSRQAQAQRLVPLLEEM